MRTLHKTLHLQHHSHTGRLLHHKHTSYRGLAVIIGLAGLCMVGFTAMARATADSLYVYARIPAPIPTGAPTITAPADGTITDKASLTVDGTCPVVTPRVVIVLIDNGSQVGSVPCDTGNNFEIPITLTAGDNVLIARAYTITGDTGPDSSSVTVHYTPPLPPVTTTETPVTAQTTTPVSEPGVPPLTLTTDTPFITFGPQKDAVWIGTIGGGTPPYSLSIDWGDNVSESYQIAQPGQLQYQHHYQLMQPYDITIQLRDSAGQILTRHYAAVTPYVAPPSTGLFTTKPTSPPFWAGPKVIGVYGAYLTVLAGFGWVWIHAAGAPAYAHVRVHVRHKGVRLKGKRR